MTRPWRQYAVLPLLLLAAGSYEAVDPVPSTPFAIHPATRTIRDGPLSGDEILSLNGRPFVGAVQYEEAVRHAHPGDKLHLVLSEPSGRAVEKMVTIPARARRLDLFAPLFLIGPFQAIAILLFGLYFPVRFAPDRRKPWVKYIFLIPAFGAEATRWAINGIWRHDIAASQVFAPVYPTLSHIRIVIDVLSILGFFVVLSMKINAKQSPDNLRRLRILRVGSSLAFVPMAPIVLFALIRHREIPEGIPVPLGVVALCIMALFPVTLIYVIVVGRAMDLSIMIRESVSSSWLDKKFFPEAYNAELLLSELAFEAERHTGIDSLLETVARRIDAALHVEDIVILVREGNVCRTRYSTRHGEPMDIPVDSHILSARGAQPEPLQVFPDDPQPWMRSLDTIELQTLAYMRSQVLLVLTGQGGQVAGVMSLGAKKSGEAYSPTELRLLQPIATRMGMAIDNLTT